MLRRRPFRLVVAVVFFAAGVVGVKLAWDDSAGLSGVVPAESVAIQPETADDGVSSTASTGTTETAHQVLSGLPVKGRASMTGYDRDEFGNGWADTDHDGCSTREEILQRDLTGKTYSTSGGCDVIASGQLDDPYSGLVIAFRHGTDTSAMVQIDHVVALADSWQKGAQQLTPDRREALANDPLNLLAVDGSLNQQKSASDAASWLPPDKAYRCQYVARQVAVKAKYDLWVTSAEKDAIDQILLTDCPAQPIPQD
jgi:hypothetical protein